ncbi:MAG TPA: hypothetical protein VN180_04375 [Acidimicrobiia bacterium]|nr:hypothetical protein [Acidimicrobiia bacterium]
MALVALPARDPDARARLAELGGRARPVVLARDRALAVPGSLGELLPDGLVRGSVAVVDGVPGSGATSVALTLCAAVTGVGEWAAAVDLEGTLGGEAAAAAGVDLERFVVARRVPPARWATTIDVLLDGMSLVVGEVPRHLRAGDARRLEARTRERGGVLLALIGPASAWPAGATARLRVEGGPWPGLGAGHGLLTSRSPQVRVAEHGTRERVGVLAG